MFLLKPEPSEIKASAGQEHESYLPDALNGFRREFLCFVVLFDGEGVTVNAVVIKRRELCIGLLQSGERKAPDVNG